VNRPAMHWAAFVLSLVAVLSVAVALQSFSELGNRRWDLTLQSRLSLSPYSQSVLGELKGPLEIDYYYGRGERIEARDLLELVTEASSQVRYELIDLDRNPQRAKDQGVRRYDQAVLSYDGRERVVPAKTEELLMGGIAQIVQAKARVLYFLGGHRERGLSPGYDDQLGRAAQFLRSEGYDLRTLSLVRGESIPEDASAVVIAGPEVDLVEHELERLDAYLRAGGAVLVLVDPVQLPHFEQWIAKYGLRLSDDVVIDQVNRVEGSDGTNVLVPVYREHEATQALTAPAVLGRARSISTLDGGAGDLGAPVQVVARTMPESFVAAGSARTRAGLVAFDAATDRRGPVGVMGVSIGEDGGRLVVIGDADFASDNFITLLGNRDLLVNVLGWLTGGEASGARVQAEAAAPGPLSPVYVSARLSNLIFWIAVIAQPGVVLLVGIAVVLRRRRRR